MLNVIALLSRLPGRVAGAAVGAVVAGLVLSDSEAHALIVNVNGQNYEVSTFTGSYNDNISKFDSAANGGVMPWYGSQTDADAFASAVGANLGMFYGKPNYGQGPFYAYALLNPTTVELVYNDGSAGSAATGVLNTRVWAQAALVPAAGSANVPGPLPAVGLAVAFGFSRQLRKRIKASASNPPSASTEA